MDSRVDLGPWFDNSHWQSCCNGPVPVGEAFVPEWMPAITACVPLSSAHRMLLATDGSITKLLEAVCGRAIDARVLRQEDVPATPLVAEQLEAPVGHAVTLRLVKLCDAERVICVAGSLMALDRLPPIVKEQLYTTTIPIGRVIVSSGVRAHRRSVSVDVARPRAPLELFGPLADDRFLVRDSRLVTEGRIFAMIREYFPYSVFAYELAAASVPR